MAHDLRSGYGGGAELHQNRSCGGHEFFHARDRLALQRVEQCEGGIQIGQLDQQGVAVDGEKAHGVRFGMGHNRSHHFTNEVS